MKSVEEGMLGIDMLLPRLMLGQVQTEGAGPV